MLGKWFTPLHIISSSNVSFSFSSTLMAITNTAATLPGIIVPNFVGSITHGNVSSVDLFKVTPCSLETLSLQQTIEAWRVIFYVTVALYVVEILAYMFMGSGEQQPWNTPDASNNPALIERGKSGTESTPLNERDTKKYESDS